MTRDGRLIRLSIAAARQEIDNIDTGILALLRVRFNVSQQVQKTRIGSGGARVDLDREADIRQKYRSFFGQSGDEVANAVLRLCRS
ncbi:chorismate mutase [Amycolatopsis sp. VS8301801F10]|uniref:chorismate mutase n=1 Tax=Amycolatopsis sp. VS8301801F10 TaxID=2652442 RepID=UPI0038FC53FC